MNCRDFEHLLKDYIDGTLPDGLRADMDAHRSACRSCARICSIQLLIGESLKDTGRVSAPSGLTERILGAVKREVPENVINIQAIKPCTGEVSANSTKTFDCEVFGEHAAAFVDGSLDTVLTAAMKDHLEHCRFCRGVVRMHMIVLDALDSARPVPVPGHLAANILDTAGIPELITIRNRKRMISFGTLIAAAGALIAAFVSVWNGVTVTPPAGATFSIVTGTLWAYAVSGLMTIREEAIIRLARLTGPYAERFSVLTDPVTLPYSTVSMPTYYLLGIALVSWVAWMCFNKPISATQNNN